MADEDLCLSCPICMGKYSATRYPIVAPNCGHSLCIECGKKRKSNECVLCLGSSFRALDGIMKAWPSDQWNKNFTLLDLVNLRAAESKSSGIDSVECSGCHSMEKRERMKICGTCAGEWNKEWEGMKEEEIRSFILCGLCCYEEHIIHDIIKYLPWKLNQLLNSTVTDGMDAVSSMDELCSHEFGRVKDQMKEWEEKMSAFRSVECCTHQAGLSIANTLHHESDEITQMSESCLPPLRKLRKAVTDSSARLDQFKREIEGGKLKLEMPAKAEPSEADNMKADLEKKIQELEQKNRVLELKKEEGEKKIKEEMRQAFKKALTSSVHVSRLIVEGALNFSWFTGPTFVDRLYMSVSHTMYLAAVDMYKAKNAPETGTTGSFDIFDCDTPVVSHTYTLLKGDSNDTTEKVTFVHAVQLTPNKQYRLQLIVDKRCNTYYGEQGTANVGSFDIFDCDTPVVSHTYTLLKGDSNDTTEKVTFVHAVQLTPNKQYRLQLIVDKRCNTYYGEQGTANVAVPDYPGHRVTFTTHPDNNPGRGHDTSATFGQFAGFHFRIGK